MEIESKRITDIRLKLEDEERRALARVLRHFLTSDNPKTKKWDNAEVDAANKVLYVLELPDKKSGELLDE